MIARICAYLKSRDGATAIEYGLIAAAISVAIAAIVFTVGGNLTDVFEVIGDRLGDASEQAGGGAPE